MVGSLSGVIVAGGKSTRFGSDKASAAFLGRPQLRVVLDALTHITDDIIITRAANQDLPDLGHDAPAFRLARDAHHEQGPLAGLIAGLEAARHDLALAVSTDVPLLQPRLIEHLVSLAPGHDAVLPHIGSHPQPLVAVYRPSTCLDVLRASFEAGNRRIVEATQPLNVLELREADLQPYDPQLLSFRNANTPGDLAELERLAGR